MRHAQAEHYTQTDAETNRQTDVIVKQ